MDILESERLLLRPWKLSDLDDLHNITSNSQVAKLAGFRVKKNNKEYDYAHTHIGKY